LNTSIFWSPRYSFCQTTAQIHS